MEEKKELDNIIIEGAKIIWPNFSGKETEFNREGCRNFNILIEDPDTAIHLRDDGWNIREKASRDPDGTPMYILPVFLRFDILPPKIVMVTRRNKTILDEMTVGSLDYAEIKNVDITIRPYNWKLKTGKYGTKAMVKNMYVTIDEDPLEEKYDM